MLHDFSVTIESLKPRGESLARTVETELTQPLVAISFYSYLREIEDFA